MAVMASQITSVLIVYTTVCTGTDQRKHQTPALLAFVRGIHRWPVNSPHKGPVMWKMFPFDDIIILNNHLYRRRSKKTSKLHVTGLCEGNSPVTGEFPSQRASYVENVSIWWRHLNTGPCYNWPLYWASVLGLLIGPLYWASVLWLCTGTLYCDSVQGHCTGTLYHGEIPHTSLIKFTAN